MSKPIEELTFSDSFMFGAVLTRNLGLCKEILELILDRRISSISFSNAEQYLEAAPDSKSVRLDVYLEDDTSKAYDFEMQAYDEPDIAARSRYYQANVDINLMAKKEKYQDLPDSYIIFVCTKDYFNRGLCKYTYENICHETGDPLNDRTKKIFLNAAGEDKTISSGLRDFLDYIAGKGTHSDLTERIDAAVAAARKDRNVRMAYLSYDLALQSSEDRGIAKGEIISIVDQIWKKLKKNKPISVIADETETDEQQVERIVELIHSHGEDYDKKVIGSEYMEKYYMPSEEGKSRYHR
ncbi:MAG: Rpn family recombination-promoting nuclease/putative transposase [Lachnospiraceae bacterium]|nr:Rpn family recombination-promoting nuclease/putative transposase [Lachnospiraceae bacterium]